MFVTVNELSRPRQKKQKDPKSCVIDKNNSWIGKTAPVLTKDNTTITDDKITFTTPGWFGENIHILPADDDNYSKFKYYRNNKYLFKVIKKSDNKDYDVDKRCEYVKKINGIHNAVFCYGIHEMDDCFIEVYDSYMTLKEIEAELENQKDPDDINVLSKIMEAHKICYYSKMANFINEIHKKGLRGVVTNNHIFIDPNNGDIKIIPQLFDSTKYSDQYMLVLLLGMWITGIKFSKDAIDNYKNFNFNLEETSTLMNSILKEDVTYNTIENGIGIFKHNYSNDFSVNPIVKDSGVWIENKSFYVDTLAYRY